MQGLVSLPGIEPTLDELPALLTVDDVAAVLRIGKSLAYTLARQYEASGGTQGVRSSALAARFVRQGGRSSNS